MTVIELHTKLRGGQSLYNGALEFNLFFFFCHSRLRYAPAENLRRLSLTLLPLLKLALPTLQAANRLLALDSAQFALGDKPSLPSNGAQDAAFGDLFPESLQELLA
jgi:hypothetical protein